MARALNVLILTGLGLAFGPPPAPPAQAAPKQTLFIFQTDQFSSFWRNQRQVPVEPPGGECPPVGPCLSIPVRLSNPDGADTIPVAASPEVQDDGSTEVTAEKMSALLFDISAPPRNVPLESTVTRFTVSILEEGSRNADGKKIKACRITDVWAHSESGAELWGDRPPFESSGCVQGTRNVGATEIRWEFNVTPLSGLWGQDPLENYGFMLVPDIPAGAPPTETWQITLKAPQPNNETTMDANEYEDTKNRIRLVYDFTPPPPEVVDDGGDDGDIGGGTGGGDTGGGVEPEPPPPAPTTEPTPEPTTEPEPVAETKTPGPPGQVWLLLPAGLFALALTRSAVEEPIGETSSAGGVVAAIRRRNAAARGEQPGEAAGPKAKGFLGRFRR